MYASTRISVIWGLAPAGARVTHTGNLRARLLIEAAGFAGIRLTRVMRIELQEEPPQPAWPQGILCT
jgi:hypothetical protein